MFTGLCGPTLLNTAESGAGSIVFHVLVVAGTTYIGIPERFTLFIITFSRSGCSRLNGCLGGGFGSGIILRKGRRTSN
jgi:hypothetical protein